MQFTPESDFKLPREFVDGTSAQFKSFAGAKNEHLPTANTFHSIIEPIRN